MLLCAVLLTVSLTAQEFGQRKGFRGIVAKKDKPTLLNEVEVSTSAAGDTYATAARTVTVLTAKEIQELPVNTINEVLEYVAGLDVRQRGPLDVQSDIGVRGGTFDQALVLVNGIRMNNMQTGHHNMNLPIPLAMIERIEILHGGASRVHGVGAMTGVINIVLKKAQTKLNGGYRTAVGAHGLQQHALNVGLKVGKWGAMVGMQRDQSSVYVDNTDFESDRFMIALERDVTFLGFQGGLSLLYAENQKAFGAADYYTTTFPDQFEATTTTLFGTSLRLAKNKLSYALDLNYVGGTDRFELYRETPGQGGFDASYVAYQFDLNTTRFYRPATQDTAAAWYTGHNHHRTGAYTINERVTYEWNPLHTTTAGINLRYDDIRSNALGTIGIVDQTPIPGWPGSYTRYQDQLNISYFLEHRYTSGPMRVTAGVMLNQRQLGEENFVSAWSPGVDVAYKLGKVTTAYASADQSVRYPTYTDLYYARGNAFGSIDLQHESALNLEAGLRRGVDKNIRYNAALFHRRSANLIDWVTYPGNDTAYAQNITALNLTGLEANFGYYASKRKDFVRSVVGSVLFMNGASPEVDYSSLYALDYLAAKANITVNNRLGKGLYLKWALTAQDRVGTYRDASTGDEVAYAPFVIADAKLYWAPIAGITRRQIPFQAFVNINNAFGTQYYDRGNVAQPGRWISAGFELRFR